MDPPMMTNNAAATPPVSGGSGGSPVLGLDLLAVQKIVVAMFTKAPGTYWLPGFTAPSDLQNCQPVNDRLTIIVDPPHTSAITPPQLLYRGFLCVSKCVQGMCQDEIASKCPHIHKTSPEVIADVEALYIKSKTSVREDDLERIETCATAVPVDKMQAWLAKHPRVWLAMIPKTRVTYWLRKFGPIAEHKVPDPTWQHTPGGAVVIVQNPTVAELKLSEPVQLYSKQLCVYFINNRNCERPNCIFLHRVEEDIRFAVAKRHYELKAMPKGKRMAQIIAFNALGIPITMSTSQLIQHQLMEKEARKQEKKLLLVATNGAVNLKSSSSDSSDEESGSDSDESSSSSSSSSSKKRHKRKDNSKRRRKSKRRRSRSRSRSRRRRSPSKDRKKRGNSKDRKKDERKSKK